MWWQIGCPVSRVNTCILSYLLCDLVVMLIVLSCVFGCVHDYLLCDLVVTLTISFVITCCVIHR